MSLFTFFKTPATAPVARERLQILLAHERTTLGPRNLVAILRDELLATIARHIEIAPEALKVKMGQSGAISTLEIDVEKSHSLNDVFARLTALGIAVHSMRNKANRLEELFVSLVEKNLNPAKAG